MTRSAGWVVCLVIALAMGCGGDGPTPPPPAPSPPPTPQRTLDTLKIAFERPDLQDAWPSDVSVTAVLSTGERTIPIVTAGNDHDLIVPTGLGTFTLRVNGGAKYETRTWTVQSGQGRRHAAVLHPNCWSIRMGEFAGQNICLVRSQLITIAGNGDNSSFYRQLNPSSIPSPWGWRENLLPAKVMLADPYSAGQNWSAEDSAFVTSQIERVNQSWGRTMLAMAGRTADTLTTSGVIKVVRRQDNSQPNDGAYRGSLENGDIQAGLVRMAATGLRSPGGLAHEFMHVLGFGHTCQFVTGMITIACNDKWNPPTYWFTASDIAGFQMAYALRAQAKRINANLPYF